MYQRITNNKVCIILLFLVFQAFSAHVISWVPPYGIERCKNVVQAEWGGYGPKDGLSHLALQFWMPDWNGGVEFDTRFSGVGPSSVRWFRDWARQYGIKTMLCIYNATDDGWDWNMAVNAFRTNQDATISNLISIMEEYDLDGIEIDLEGMGGNASAQDSAAFVQFISKLGSEMDNRGKDLTVATFAARWNSPNANYWDHIAPHVTAFTSMGYEEIGANASEWRGYAGQKAFTQYPDQLMLGMPASKSSWQNDYAQTHVNWVRNDGVAGVGIWDIQLQSSAWQTQEIWQALNDIRGEIVTRHTVSASSSGGGTIDPSGDIQVINGGSQSFSFEPESFYVVEDIRVNGQSVGSHETYTLENITSDMTIYAEFVEDHTPPEDIILSSKQGPSEKSNALVGYLEAVDQNPGDHTFRILEGGQEFSINGNELRTARELEEGQYPVTIEAEDEGGLTVSKDFTISIMDEDLIHGDNVSGYLGWYVYHDELGTSVDTGQSLVHDDSVVTVDFSMTTSDPDNDEYAYGALGAEIDTNLGDPGYMIMEYKTGNDFQLVLPMETVTQEGGEYRTDLSATQGSWKSDTIMLTTDRFSQPEWAEEATFDKSTTSRIEITPNFEGTSGEVEIRVVRFEGLSAGEIPLVTDPDATQRAGITLEEYGNNRVTLAVPRRGRYELAAYTVSGRQLTKKSLELQRGNNGIDISRMDGTGTESVLILKIEGMGVSETIRISR
ncbi:MAG: glycosyl hydrolase family 18 protein [Fibrobacterota bacterium]